MPANDPDLWSSIARKYDGLRPDQGLTDPDIRAAWASLLQTHFGAGGADATSSRTALDIGCGTGSLTLLLAELGFDATGIDFAEEMIAVAREKATALALDACFEVADASAPPFGPAAFDAIVCRQVLWALPNPNAALARWADLLRPNGRILLIEGRFASGNGLGADEILSVLPATLTPLATADLSPRADLWGQALSDERVLLVLKKLPRD